MSFLPMVFQLSLCCSGSLHHAASNSVTSTVTSGLSHFQPTTKLLPEAPISLRTVKKAYREYTQFRKIVFLVFSTHLSTVRNDLKPGSEQCPMKGMEFPDLTRTQAT